MKKHHQTCLKAILVENINDFDSFWALFLYWKIHGKGRFSSYPAEFEREYLENGARYRHSVKSADFVLKNTFI